MEFYFCYDNKHDDYYELKLIYIIIIKYTRLYLYRYEFNLWKDFIPSARFNIIAIKKRATRTERIYANCKLFCIFLSQTSVFR